MMRLILAVVLVAAMAGPLLAQEAQPWEAWEPPVVTLPQPNGFDTYLEAFALKDQIDRDWQVKDWTEATRAAQDQPPDRWGEGPPPLPLPDRLSLYSKVLKLVRVALTQDCRIPAPISPTEVMPYLASFRAVTRLLVMEAEVRRLEGDNLGAAASALDGLMVAQDASSQRTLISYLVGVACEAIATRSLDETIPDLKAEQCKQVLTRMLQIESARLPLAETLDGEEISTRITLKRWLTSNTEQQRRMTAEWEVTAPEFKTLLEGMNIHYWQSLEQTYDILRQVAAMPYPRRPKPLPVPQDVYAEITMPIGEKMLFKHAQALTALHLREAELAARAYLLEKKQLPAELQALVPDYLTELPSDPFGEGPLRARLAQGKLVIYSIGPDITDDGGKPLDTQFPEPSSKGDISVAVSAGR
jgi:hypothetical protein